MDSGYGYGKIPIVSTDIPDLDTPCSLVNTDTGSVFSYSKMAPSEACNNASRKLLRCNNLLKARIFMLDVEDISSGKVGVLTQ